MSRTPPPTKLDPQDPLPESSWFFRRLLMFGFATLFTASVVWTTILITRLAFHFPGSATAAIHDLTSIVIGLAWMNALAMVTYLVAPSGEQVAKMAAIVIAARSGGLYGGMGRMGGGMIDPPCEEPLPPVNEKVPGNEDLSGDMTKKEGS